MILYSICMSVIGYLPVSVLGMAASAVPDSESIGWRIVLALFLVLLNGFFVAAEFAIVKVRASQIELKAKSGSSVKKIAKHITQHLGGYLAATQLGITLASLGLGWVGEAVMTEIVHRFFAMFGIALSSSLGA